MKVYEKMWSTVISVFVHPDSAIDGLGHCQREIRIRLTISWLMLNQEKSQTVPVYLRKWAIIVKMISSLFIQLVFTTICYAHSQHRHCIKCPSCSGASSWAQKSFGQWIKELESLILCHPFYDHFFFFSPKHQNTATYSTNIYIYLGSI